MTHELQLHGFPGGYYRLRIHDSNLALRLAVALSSKHIGLYYNTAIGTLVCSCAANEFETIESLCVSMGLATKLFSRLRKSG